MKRIVLDLLFSPALYLFLLSLAQVRELETMLEEEKTQRAQALTVKKQLETELQEAEAQVEAANRGREEALRQMKRLQVRRFNYIVK